MKRIVIALMALSWLIAASAALAGPLEVELEGAVYLDDIGKTRKLLDKGANINARANNNSWTPLELASMGGSTEIVKLLLSRGADVRISRDGWSALTHAASWGHADIVKLLIDKGADVNEADKNGVTILGMVNEKIEKNKLNNKKENYEKIVRLLNAAGAKDVRSKPVIFRPFTAADRDFLIKQCQVLPMDVEIIPQLTKETQASIIKWITAKDCRKLVPLKETRNYYRKLKMKERLPTPPATWHYDYLTESEWKRYTEILDKAPL